MEPDLADRGLGRCWQFADKLASDLVSCCRLQLLRRLGWGIRYGSVMLGLYLTGKPQQ